MILRMSSAERGQVRRGVRVTTAATAVALLAAILSQLPAGRARGSATAIPTTDQPNEHAIYNYFASHGLTPTVAAALVGNIQVESNGGNPAAGEGSAHQGIVQWSSGRWAGVQSFASSDGVSPYTLLPQEQDTVAELNGSYTSVESQATACGPDVDCATQVIFSGYESPGDSTLPKRQGYAEWVVLNWAHPLFGLGVVRVSGADKVWYLDNDVSGSTSEHVTYGASADRPVAGDWDGNGSSTPGEVRVVNDKLVWYLSNGLDGNTSITPFTYGVAGDIPVVGDWDGNGTDTPGVVRASGSNAVWYLSNNFTGVTSINPFTYGLASDKPVAGDWDGNGTDTPGMVRASGSNAVWYLNNGFDSTTNAGPVTYGLASDIPVAGAWTG